MTLLGLVYAGVGWGLYLHGLPAWAVTAVAGVVLAGRWLAAERLALAATGARQAGPQEAQDLRQALARLCALAGQPARRLALSPDPAPNAFTVGRSRRRATIVVTQGLRCRLDPRELEAVLAHELAHVTHRDTVEDLVRLGSEVERRVLARAVRWHLEDRILVDGVRTVVFE